MAAGMTKVPVMHLIPPFLATVAVGTGTQLRWDVTALDGHRQRHEPRHRKSDGDGFDVPPVHEVGTQSEIQAEPA